MRVYLLQTLFQKQEKKLMQSINKAKIRKLIKVKLLKKLIKTKLSNIK